VKFFASFARAQPVRSDAPTEADGFEHTVSLSPEDDGSEVPRRKEPPIFGRLTPDKRSENSHGGPASRGDGHYDKHHEAPDRSGGWLTGGGC
jgi:hypothetical protein